MLIMIDLTLQTETNDVPLAILAFQGRLAAGIGKSLRIYDMGKKKLLRKVENKVRQYKSISSKRYADEYLSEFHRCYRHSQHPGVSTSRW